MKLLTLWYLPAAVTLLLLVGGPLAARLHVLPPILGFLTFASAAIPGVISLGFGLGLLLRGDTMNGIAAAVTGALPWLLIAFGLFQARALPRINDISTDLDTPPSLVAAANAPDNQGKDLAYPEKFKDIVRSGYPDLSSLSLPEAPQAVYERAKHLASEHPGWTITRADDGKFELEGEDTRGVFQFTDDFVIRVMPAGPGSKVDMRSRSRVGKGDFGANAQRIRAFLTSLANR